MNGEKLRGQTKEYVVNLEVSLQSLTEDNTNSSIQIQSIH